MFHAELVLISTAVVIMPFFESVVQPQISQCSPDSSKFTFHRGHAYFYAVYEEDVTSDQARCICASLPDTRLAVFDVIDMRDVSNYLAQTHTDEDLVVDAKRETQNTYTWATDCSLPLTEELWGPGEPKKYDRNVRLKVGATKSVYYGIHTEQFKALCQSDKPPKFNYAPTPPTLTWVSLGTVGHWFGFSNEVRNLEDARTGCAQQEGHVYLATLDLLYDEVVEHALKTYPDTSFWVDTVSSNDPEESNHTYQWTTGGNVSDSYLSNDTKSGIVLFQQNGVTGLTESSVFFKHHFICEGYPATEWTSRDNYVGMWWRSLGTPRRRFGVSVYARTFSEAREVCRLENGRTRLAVVDTLFPEVTNMLLSLNWNAEFWVDVTRPEFAASSEFLWGNGLKIDPSLWMTSEPENDDWVGRFMRDGSGKMMLAGTAHYNARKLVLCEEVPDAVFEWHLLGSPRKLFGFSRTQSWGIEWAKHACASEPGEVFLANLDTHFEDVKQLKTHRYPGDDFWVDASLQTEDSTFLWGNGVKVENNTWLEDEPSAGGTAVILGSSIDSTGLKATRSLLQSWYFICEGRPVLYTTPQFPASCTTETPTTETTVTTETTECSTAVTESYCNCTTAPPPKVFNLTEGEKQQMVKKIQKALSVDTSKLSATVRKKTSAEDSRPSARATGTIGIVMIVLIVVMAVLPDTITVFSLAADKVTQIKKEWEGKNADDQSSQVEMGQADTDMTLHDLDDDINDVEADDFECEDVDGDDVDSNDVDGDDVDGYDEDSNDVNGDDVNGDEVPADDDNGDDVTEHVNKITVGTAEESEV